MSQNSYRIGIDLGGTKIESVLLATDGRTLSRHRIATPRHTNAAIEYSAIRDAVVQSIAASQRTIPDRMPCTIGVGIPGTIQHATGLVQNANTTSLSGRPFQKELENLLGRAIVMENDANCFTLAEAHMGAGRGYEMVFGIIMGTGCGGGICIQGRIHAGRHQIAGEWGHFSVDPAGERCYCGNPGCIETKISGGGVAKAFQRRFGRKLTLEQITAGYRQGDDPECAQAFEQFLDDYGRCVGGLISLLDPDVVVLGGGASNIDELYTLGLERVRHYAFHEQVQTPILKNQLGDSAGVFGAAWIGK
ncbi:MAG: ROK family protein [Desulfatitalea sp.]